MFLEKKDQQLLYLICMVMSQVMMCWLDSRSPRGHLVLAAGCADLNIAALMKNRLLIPSCLPPPRHAGGFGIILPVLPVGTLQPARCPPCLLGLHFSMLVREMQVTSTCREARCKGNAALLGVTATCLLAAFHVCWLAGW